MNVEPLMQRARLLLEQRRLSLAEECLGQVLASEPNHAEAHALMSICMMENRDRWNDATREAEMAVHLAPDDGFSHYVHALILQKRQRFEEALASITEALRQNPGTSHFYAVQASLFGQLSRWRDALDAATTGLSIDADNEGCTSMRSFALERLGMTNDALAEADRARARRPDSSESHSMRGWALLNSGRHLEAQEAFREALRLSPTDMFARQGMIQSLNSNHLLFRLMYRFHSRVSRLASGGQMAIVIGLVVGVQLLNQFARRNPDFEPYVAPIRAFYLFFCILSWISDPLFNTFLRFNQFGRYLLSPKQTWASNAIASLMLISISGAMIALIQGRWAAAILLFIAPLLLALPVATIFEVERGWPMAVAIGVTVLLGLLCFLSLGNVLIANQPEPFSLFALGIILFSFGGNFLRRARPQY